ncbi:hypothetical protein BS47DRAFT_1363099 [Hydnum rufescens UP504]|uniref:Uncharacterized protein n=1 Tax=Hydnum rufescens UP504 TaxID=1448309 RepID=A0A9P6AV63_9AGAM|nr:hypothetical protein BS47DRAFT_1363099 [Hydnum rufescens UP504]
MTVTTTTETFTEIFTRLAKKYKNYAPAAALFYWDNGATHGVRVEAPSILKEFVDNVAWGKDPEGTLFFNDVKDLDNDPPMTTTGATTTQQAVVVQFYADTQGSFFAEFVGKDPSRAVTYILEARKGRFLPLNSGSASAHVKKKSSESKVTVKISAIGKEVTFNVPDNSAAQDIDVWGNLTFKKLSDLKSGTLSVVNYNDDRILFYPTNGQQAMHAIFIPIETTAADATALGTYYFVTSSATATWSDI